jgi:NTP pyrophosphatase (non-canonical NTP hydrolase)
MKTFEEYQTLATQAPLSLRNTRDRIELPVLGLQEEAGKIGSLLAQAFASGKFSLTQEQTGEVKDRLADVLWCVAFLCNETGFSMQDLAAHSIAQLQERTKRLDPDRR